MMKKLKDVKHSLETGASVKSVIGDSSFLALILVEVLPIGAKVPHMDMYDGIIDPKDHLSHFQKTMVLHNFSDVILCKTLPIILKEVARTWFNQLLVSSISSFRVVDRVVQGTFFA